MGFDPWPLLVIDIPDTDGSLSPLVTGQVELLYLSLVESLLLEYFYQLPSIPFILSVEVCIICEHGATSERTVSYIVMEFRNI